MDDPIVTVRQGQLRGSLRTDIDGGDFFSFLGIPYAKPPLGELRFKAPLPADSWSGIRDGSQEGNMCYSRNEITMTVMGSEDCLFLNVFTKELPKVNANLKSVMVWIHGGGFIFGSSKLTHYGPEFLMMEDIVLVSLNYRLGILGFLNLEDTSLGVPGNAGLKDQALALKWVQENIEYFGGDSNNVMIFGESAGAAAVHYHVLSKASKGLFHKAILQSGTALNFWESSYLSATEFAKYVGYDVDNEKEALDVLRYIPVEELFEKQEQYLGEFRPNSIRLFGPVAEPPHETNFITEKDIDVITSGEYNKVPLLIGYTTREGMLVDYFISSFGRKDNTKDRSLEDVIFSQINLKKDTEIGQRIYKKVMDVYFKGGDKDDNIRVLVSDRLFVARIVATLKNHLKTSKEPIYLYRMSLDAKLNYLKNLGKLNHLSGVSHADDLGYLFKSVVTPEFEPDSLEDVLIRRFVKLWTNFAKYGNPTPDKNELGVIWEPAEENQINFLDIGKELTLGTNPEPERWARYDLEVVEGNYADKVNTSDINYLVEGTSLSN